MWIALTINFKKTSQDENEFHLLRVSSAHKAARGLAVIAALFSLTSLIWSSLPKENIAADSFLKTEADDCGYQIVQDGKVLGTVFFKKSAESNEILNELDARNLSDYCKGEIFPCNSVLIFGGDGRLVDVQTLPGAQIVSCGKRIDLNSASEIDIQSVPGIGPELAKRIQERKRDFGPFEGLDDLAKIRGIGRRKASDLKIYLK